MLKPAEIKKIVDLLIGSITPSDQHSSFVFGDLLSKYKEDASDEINIFTKNVPDFEKVFNTAIEINRKPYKTHPSHDSSNPSKNLYHSRREIVMDFGNGERTFFVNLYSPYTSTDPDITKWNNDFIFQGKNNLAVFRENPDEVVDLFDNRKVVGKLSDLDKPINISSEPIVAMNNLPSESEMIDFLNALRKSISANMDSCIFGDGFAEFINDGVVRSSEINLFSYLYPRQAILEDCGFNYVSITKPSFYANSEISANNFCETIKLSKNGKEFTLNICSPLDDKIKNYYKYISIINPNKHPGVSLDNISLLITDLEAWYKNLSKQEGDQDDQEEGEEGEEGDQEEEEEEEQEQEQEEGEDFDGERFPNTQEGYRIFFKDLLDGIKSSGVDQDCIFGEAARSIINDYVSATDLEIDIRSIDFDFIHHLEKLDYKTIRRPKKCSLNGIYTNNYTFSKEGVGSFDVNLYSPHSSQLESLIDRANISAEDCVAIFPAISYNHFFSMKDFETGGLEISDAQKAIESKDSEFMTNQAFVFQKFSNSYTKTLWENLRLRNLAHDKELSHEIIDLMNADIISKISRQAAKIAREQVISLTSVEQDKPIVMQNNHFNWVKKNAEEGFVQGMAATAVDAFSLALINSFKAANMDSKTLDLIQNFLNQPVGKSLLSAAMSASIHFIPVEQIQSNEKVQRIGDKCMQNAAAGGVHELGSLVMNYVVPAVLTAISPSAEVATSEMVRVSVPQLAAKPEVVTEIEDVQENAVRVASAL